MFRCFGDDSYGAYSPSGTSKLCNVLLQGPLYSPECQCGNPAMALTLLSSSDVVRGWALGLRG